MQSKPIFVWQKWQNAILRVNIHRDRIDISGQTLCSSLILWAPHKYSIDEDEGKKKRLSAIEIFWGVVTDIMSMRISVFLAMGYLFAKKGVGVRGTKET